MLRRNHLREEAADIDRPREDEGEHSNSSPIPSPSPARYHSGGGNKETNYLPKIIKQTNLSRTLEQKLFQVVLFSNLSSALANPLHFPFFFAPSFIAVMRCWLCSFAAPPLPSFNIHSTHSIQQLRIEEGGGEGIPLGWRREEEEEEAK